MAKVVIVTPNPLLDCLHDGSITPGQVTRSSGMDLLAGGKGLNVGRILKNHGHQVIACGFAGGWTGDAFRAIVRSEGQEDAFTNCTARLRLGFLAKDCAGAGSTALLENGFAVSANEQTQLLQNLTQALTDADLCIVSGSVPDESCVDLFTQIAQCCHQEKIACWVDSYGAAMDAVLQSDYVPALAKPNKEEYSTSSHWQRLPECHITNGAEATEVKHPDGLFTVQAPQITCVNPIGSGDSYIAGLAHARLSGQTLSAQLAYASAAGAANASQLAVAKMSIQEIKDLTPQVSVTPNSQA